MSIVLSIVFISILLLLGFGWNAWNLVAITLIFTFGLSGLLATSNIEETRANWKERRCDMDVIMMAGLYKPKDYDDTKGSFASENFDFCMRSFFQSIIAVILTPVFMIIGQQLDVTENVNQTLDRFRMMLATFASSFQKILDPFWKRFQMTSDQVAVNFHKFYMAMSRAFGIVVASLYMGLGLTVSIENFVAFIIRVVIIIMYIILSVLFILIIGILPFFPIIIAVCQTIGNSPFGYMAEDVCGELCLDPDTSLKLKSGHSKAIRDVKLGDTLEDGSIIEGILRVKGDHEPLYSLDGIKVSGSHMMWNGKSWIMTKENPRAQRISYRSQELYCLRTNTHRIPIRGKSGKLWYFLDWEELPSNVSNVDGIWDTLIQSILNGEVKNYNIPTQYPMMKRYCQVMYKTGEFRGVHEVKLGDEIYSSQGFTKVIGLYEGECEFLEDSSLSDGIWCKAPGESKWTHPPPSLASNKKEKGFHLLTESGCFWIMTNSFSGFVRDFTEVGKENLVFTYPYTQHLLNKEPFDFKNTCFSAIMA